MNKTLLLAAGLFFSTLTHSANNSGEAVYEANCKTCHMQKPMMDKSKMMKMSKEERMSMMQKMRKTMKAPPMSKISAKLKHDLKDDKTQIVTFIKEYLVNPDAKKARCMPMALKRFGVMPAIGKNMSAKDIDTVANWMVDNFDEKWDEKAMGMMCNTEMKEDAHKCGSSMKCASGKCGGK